MNKKIEEEEDEVGKIAQMMAKMMSDERKTKMKWHIMAAVR